MTNNERPGTPASKHILGLILAVLGAVAGYLLVSYLMSR